MTDRSGAAASGCRRQSRHHFGMAAGVVVDVDLARLILLRAANLSLQGGVKARLWFSMYCFTMAIGAPPDEASK